MLAGRPSLDKGHPTRSLDEGGSHVIADPPAGDAAKGEVDHGRQVRGSPFQLVTSVDVTDVTALDHPLVARSR